MNICNQTCVNYGKCSCGSSGKGNYGEELHRDSKRRSMRNNTLAMPYGSDADKIEQVVKLPK